MERGGSKEETGSGIQHKAIHPSSSAAALVPPSHLIITRIFSQLDCIDLLHCSLVCKQWYTDSAELREGWRNEYLEACKLFGLTIMNESNPPSTTFSFRGSHSWFGYVHIKEGYSTALAILLLEMRTCYLQFQQKVVGQCYWHRDEHTKDNPDPDKCIRRLFDQEMLVIQCMPLICSGT